MTAPSLTWGLFGRGAHEARPAAAVPEQSRSDEAVPPVAQPVPPVAQPVPPVAQPVPPVAGPVGLLTALLPDPEPVTGPAERALLEASRELAALHPLDRLEQLEQLPAPVPAPAEAPVEPAVEVPWAVSPVLDVLPSGSTRGRRSARDLVLPAVLLAELLTGVWLGTAKPWQGESADPLQARFSSTAPASEDLRLPEPVLAPGAVPLPATSYRLPSGRPSAETSRAAAGQVDPFRPR